MLWIILDVHINLKKKKKVEPLIEDLPKAIFMKKQHQKNR